jgi:hypothetical protein
MKEKLITQLHNIRDEIVYAVRRLCGRPTPGKRIATVLLLCGMLAVGNLYYVITSIYSAGRRDAKREFLNMEHIKRLDWQPVGKDSINQLKQKMYEQQSDR